MEVKPDKTWIWIIVTISVAIIGCVGAVLSALISKFPLSTPTPPVTTQIILVTQVVPVTEVLTSVAFVPSLAPNLSSVPTTYPTATIQQVLPTFQPVLKSTPTLQPPWDILLNDWQDSKILKKSGDKTAIAVGTFIFKVISSKGNYCGIVTSGSTLDSMKEFNTPLLEYYPTTRNNLLIYLTMSDGKNNDSYDMEDFCLDPPGYTFVIMHETNGIIAMQQIELPIPSAP